MDLIISANYGANTLTVLTNDGSAASCSPLRRCWAVILFRFTAAMSMEMAK